MSRGKTDVDIPAIELRARQVTHDRVLSGDDPTVATPLLRFLEVAHRLDDLVQDAQLRMEKQISLESENQQMLELLTGILKASNRDGVARAIAKARSTLTPKTEH